MIAPAPRALWRQAVDAAVIVALGTLVTLTFGPVFGGFRYLIAGLGGTALGVGVAIATTRGPLRGWLMTVAGVMLVYVVFGCALAVPSQTIWGFVPTAGGLQELLLGTVFSWKGLLTAEPPAEGFPSLLVVPFLTLLVSTAAGAALALGPRRVAPFGIAPPALALAVAISFGTADEPYSLLTGVGFGLVALGWLSWRAHERRAGRRADARVGTYLEKTESGGRRRIFEAVAMLAVAGVAGTAVGHFATPDVRQVLRDDVQPPISLADYPSPLSGFRQWHKTYTDESLVTVSGMPEDARLRLATLDTYTGQVMGFASESDESGSGAFALVGEEIHSEQSGEAVDVDVRIDAYQGIWTPTVGYSTSIDFEGDRAPGLQSQLHYNGNTGTAVTMPGLQPGDEYSLSASVPRAPQIEQLRGAAVSEIALPQPASVPAQLQSWVQTHGTTQTSTLDNILHMQQQLQGGAFSHGLESDPLPSLAGHSVYRIADMVAEENMIGDDEQYAVVFALALRTLGVPARVVMGMYPDGGFTSSSVSLTGSDVHAWVEVPFEGHGWVPFDAMPPEDNTEINLDPPPKPQPQPRVLQPPQPPNPPQDEAPDAAFDDGDAVEDDAEELTGWMLWLSIGALALGVLLLLASPFIVIALLKRRRRKRRMRAPDMRDRLSGGWHELVDTAVDFGAVVPAGATRREVASELHERYPQSDVLQMGDIVDRGVFDADEPDQADVRAFWEDVAKTAGGMHASSSRRERLRAALSLQSFRLRARERRSRG
ncbi:MAG: transglutaminase-like domain-containing protein [Agrococcus casei]|uniref:transglutaminase-like domain-containing protein n=1 Tax=Agrococcus casei TaxID=343512 RepID=UPI003F96535B